MKINRLVIENFKSIERIELVEPNPFTVFVGPNGSGKSNIFEALEFFNLTAKTERGIVEGLFGGSKSFLHRNSKGDNVQIDFHLTGSHKISLVQRDTIYSENQNRNLEYTVSGSFWGNADNTAEFRQLVADFSRIFIKNINSQKLPLTDDQRLSLSAGNLEKVLKRILANSVLRDEIFEWLELFVPGFKAVEVNDRDELHWFESSSLDYFTKDLISDGTYNILALLTAVYQSDDKPQFLCIEEPENGLHPQVIGEFVNLCRYACEEFGHFIWLNTHSESLVRKLKTEEIVLVDKRDGATQIKQIKDMNLHDLPMDEAWLSNALGGGTPW